jgi:uncharacterized membrane protein
MILLTSPVQVSAQQSYSPRDLSVVVLREGSVNIQYTVQMNGSQATFPLIGFDPSTAATLKVQDSYNKTVPFSLQGDTVTVNVASGTLVVADYNTFKLTSKNGTQWTLRISSPVSWSVMFPLNTNVTRWSIAPEYFYKTIPPYFVFPAGNVSVTYKLSYEEQRPSPGPAFLPAVALVTGIVVFAGSFSFVMYRRYRWRLKGKRLISKNKTLNQEERRIIDFLARSKGTALETDLARALDLPRTSAWRHVRNLEDLGLVATEKFGSQNLVKMKS